MTILTNWQCDRADTAGAGYRRYKRSSRKAIEAYLETAYVLLEDRPTCTKRGSWKEYLERADIEDRTARYMIIVARSGANADDIETAGGLRAFRESLAEPKTEPEPGSGIHTPESSTETPPETPAGTAPSAHPTPIVTLPQTPPPRPAETRQALPRDAQRRADKRARGECIDCPNPSPDHARCDQCRKKGSRRDKKVRANARTGAAIRSRLETAATRGTGLRLSAEEVARILAV